MGHIMPPRRHWLESNWSRWTQSILSTPVVLWCGWPFFQRGWQLARQPLTEHVYADRDRRRRSLFLQRGGNAFCRRFSRCLSKPTAGSPIYFEAAAVITVLVLLGQVLELRARSRTGSAIRALLDLAPKTAHLLREGAETDVPLGREVRTGRPVAGSSGRKGAG